jgi:exodeoxyribonuclease VII small subunit
LRYFSFFINHLVFADRVPTALAPYHGDAMMSASSLYQVLRLVLAAYKRYLRIREKLPLQPFIDAQLRIRLRLKKRTQLHGEDTMKSMSKQDKPADKPPSFEAGLADLEQVVQKLESSDLPLEQAIEMFEKGMQLSETCRKQLTEAETKVEMLLKKGNKVEAQPFPPDKDVPF